MKGYGMRQVQKSFTIEFPPTLAGKFVAYRVENGELIVIATGDDVEEVIEKVKEKGKDPKFVQIEYVPEEEVIYLF